MFSKDQRKKLGRWGEEKLDFWMKGVGWEAILKNKYINGGEIDRVYQKMSEENVRNFCVAEIKTVFFSEKWGDISSEVFLRSFLKARQIRNIYKFS